MRLFAIADLHLSFGTDKPMDIFEGWEDHAARLYDNWQRTVSPEDTVVIPGDISWAMKLEDCVKDFSFIDKLNGRKIISKGNHDYWWTTRAKIDRFLAENHFDSINIMHNDHYSFGDIGICGTRGWVSGTDTASEPDAKILAREAGRLAASIESALGEGLKPVVFLHYPPVYCSNRNTDILEVLGRYDIRKVFYGHLHGRSHKYALNGRFEGIEYHLIASDFLHFEPMDITEIVQSDNL